MSYDKSDKIGKPSAEKIGKHKKFKLFGQCYLSSRVYPVSFLIKV